MEKLFWIGFLTVVAAVGVWEIRRWHNSNLSDVIISAHRQRRGTVLFVLLAVGAMSLWSTRFPKAKLTILQANEQFVFYGVILLLVLYLLVLAYLDIKATLTQISALRRESLISSIGKLSDDEMIVGKEQDA